MSKFFKSIAFVAIFGLIFTSAAALFAQDDGGDAGDAGGGDDVGEIASSDAVDMPDDGTVTEETAEYTEESATAPGSVDEEIVEGHTAETVSTTTTGTTYVRDHGYSYGPGPVVAAAVVGAAAGRMASGTDTKSEKVTVIKETKIVPERARVKVEEVKKDNSKSVPVKPSGATSRTAAPDA